MLHSYDQRMPTPDLTDLLRRVAAQEALSLSEVGWLIGKKRDTVYGWTRRGTLEFTADPMSQFRYIEAPQVIWLLERYRPDALRLLAELGQEPDGK